MIINNRVLISIILFYQIISICQSESDSIHFNRQPKQSNKFKNVILILADDLGWSDIGYASVEDNLKPSTPNINRLAANGIILNNFYTYALCTPSRASVMTGLFVERYGLQHSVIETPLPVGLLESLKLMPHYFKNFDYLTHLVGKWDLGSCNIKYTPVHRGFDTFYGFFGAVNDYLSHRMDYNVSENFFSGLDFWNQTKDYLESVVDKNDTFSQFVFTQRALEIIQNHDKSKPFFLYYAAQTPHTDPQDNCPIEYENKYLHIKDVKRRKILGMISLLDDAIGILIDALEESGLLKDTLIFFMSDNGGELRDSGRNYPLRGGKRTVFEGGHRVRSFIYDGGQNLTPNFYDGMFHSVDWLPTILSAAINKPVEIDGIDGRNMWNEITKNLPSRRESFIYSIDPLGNLGCQNETEAIREGDWKFIKGCPGIYTDWYNMTEFDINAYKNYQGEFMSLTENIDHSKNCLSDKNISKSFYFLFNIKDDPLEKNNLASKYPCKLKELELKLEEYKKETAPPLILEPPNFDVASNPKNFGDKWLPGWCK